MIHHAYQHRRQQHVLMVHSLMLMTNALQQSQITTLQKGEMAVE
jgi:hypothetical protein